MIENLWDEDVQQEWAEDDNTEINLLDEDLEILQEAAELDDIDWQTTARFKMERSGS